MLLETCGAAAEQCCEDCWGSLSVCQGSRQQQSDCTIQKKKNTWRTDRYDSKAEPEAGFRAVTSFWHLFMSEPNYAKLWDIRKSFSLVMQGNLVIFTLYLSFCHAFPVAVAEWDSDVQSRRKDLSPTHPAPGCSWRSGFGVCNMVTGRWTFHPSSITGQLLWWRGWGEAGGQRKTVLIQQNFLSYKDGNGDMNSCTVTHYSCTLKKHILHSQDL